jgi:hypothetical protein
LLKSRLPEPLFTPPKALWPEPPDGALGRAAGVVPAEGLVPDETLPLDGLVPGGVAPVEGRVPAVPVPGEKLEVVRSPPPDPQPRASRVDALGALDAFSRF